MVDHENLVTISCFRTFLIFILSYISNFCIYFKFFSLLVSVLFFHKILAGEGTSPILSFLHTFVMIWNKKLYADSEIWCMYKQQERHRITPTYMLINFFAIHFIFMNTLNFELVEMPC